MQRRKNSSAGNNSCLNRHVQLCAQQQPEEQLEEHVQIAPSSGVEYLPPQDTHSCSEGCSGGDDDGPPDCINAIINSMSCSTGPLALGGLCATSLAGSAVGAAAGRSHGPGTAAVARLADPQFGFLRCDCRALLIKWGALWSSGQGDKRHRGRRHCAGLCMPGAVAKTKRLQ